MSCIYTLIYNVGEINAKLGLSEQLLDDITDIIRGKGSIVSKLPVNPFLHG